jgi:hypothetical protein
MKPGDLIQLIVNPNAAQHKFYKDWFLNTMISEDPMLIVGYAATAIKHPRVFKVIHRGEEHYVSEKDAQLYGASR